MEKGYFIRRYQPSDEEEIVELLQLTFDGWPSYDLSCTPLEHWRWKYLDNPVGESIITLAINRNRIVGARHLIPQRIQIVDKSFYCVYSGDMVVHPEFRGRGISKKMSKFNREICKKRDIRFSHYITSNPILIRSYKKSRDMFPHTIINLVRIRDLDKQLKAMPMKNTWLMKLGFHILKLSGNIRNNIYSSRKSVPHLNFSRVRRFDGGINEFWRETSIHHNFIVEKNQDYLNWRYCDVNAGDFIVHQVEEDDGIKGFSVLRINKVRKDYPIGFIVDLFAIPYRLDVVDFLISNAINFFNRHNVNIINYQVVKNYPYEEVFKKHGFLNSRIKLHLFCNPWEVKSKFNKLKKSSASQVYYSYGDHDSLPFNLPSAR